MDKKYEKKVDVWKLHKELVAAGFDIDGVSYDEGTNTTTVHLKDTEKKNPDSIVEAYIYTEPKVIDYKKEFAEAKDTDAKLTVLAKMLGVTDLTDKEIEDGKLS